MIMPGASSMRTTRTGDEMQTISASRRHSAFFQKFPPEWVDRTPSALWFWLDRQRQRAALVQLDNRLLDDIGVSRQAAEQEGARWD